MPMRSFSTQARLVLLAVVALFLAVGPAALAQVPPSPAKQQPAKRAKKVWTNDDVEGLRSPSDTYLRDKERMEEDARRAREAADAAAKAAAEKGETVPESSATPGAEAAKPAPIPTTLPELEKRFAELSDKITTLESRLAGIEELKQNGSEEERGGAGELQDTLEKELEKTREEFYTVRDRLLALRRRP